MLHIVRTDSSNKDFEKLVEELDAFLAFIDGDEHAFYAQFNKTSFLKNVVVVYDNDEAVGCGALKLNDEGNIEIKRMYTLPSVRGKGVATAVLRELENWSAELGFSKLVLETGDRQPDAIALYKKNNYKIISNFGQYKNIRNSVCFEKVL